MAATPRCLLDCLSNEVLAAVCRWLDSWADVTAARLACRRLCAAVNAAGFHGPLRLAHLPAEGEAADVAAVVALEPVRYLNIEYGATSKQGTADVRRAMLNRTVPLRGITVTVSVPRLDAVLDRLGGPVAPAGLRRLRVDLYSTGLHSSGDEAAATQRPWPVLWEARLGRLLAPGSRLKSLHVDCDEMCVGDSAEKPLPGPVPPPVVGAQLTKLRLAWVELRPGSGLQLPALLSLCLEACRLRPYAAAADADMFAGWEMPRLQTLRLTQSTLYRSGAMRIDSALALARGAAEHLECLDLSQVLMGLAEGLQVAAALQHLPRLEELDLSMNNIRAPGVDDRTVWTAAHVDALRPLAQAVCAHPALCTLNVADNDYSPDAWAMLCDETAGAARLREICYGTNGTDDIGDLQDKRLVRV